MESFALGVSHGAFKVGLTDALPDHDSFIEPDVPFRSDGLRNVAKVSKTSAPVFVIYGERDQLMDPGFAKEFMLARYGADNVAAMTASNTLMISGGHNDFFVYDEFGAYEPVAVIDGWAPAAGANGARRCRAAREPPFRELLDDDYVPFLLLYDLSADLPLDVDHANAALRVL
ncbi:hypothetical protein HK405_008244 [Cladochytrium tenue]|nr:hypothetical protein HK405_008244 [Cladochytrium tenue]